MSERIHIVQIGKDEALAAILAEQAGAKSEKGKFDFDFTVVADIASASALANVWLFVGSTPSPLEGDALPAPLCIRIIHKGDAAQGNDEIVFEKPLRLAQLLDTALSSAKLRSKKQPRPLNATHEFHPFARKVVESTTARSIILTEKEASLLCAILDAGKDGLQRKDAMTELWGYHPDVDSHAVDTTLYRLRQTLQELGDIDSALVDALVNENGVSRWRGS